MQVRVRVRARVVLLEQRDELRHDQLRHRAHHCAGGTLHQQPRHEREGRRQREAQLHAYLLGLGFRLGLGLGLGPGPGLGVGVGLWE